MKMKINKIKKEELKNVSSMFALVNKFLSVIGFTQIIDNSIPWDEEQWTASPGNLCKAIIMSTFSEVRSPLYKIKDLFEDVDTELLFGEGVTSKSLNSTALGRAMDRIYETLNPETLFSTIALSAMTIYKIAFQRIHSDTTSISFYGEYDIDEENLDTEAISIERGYNKDHRPECKQMVIGQMTTEQGIPLVYQVMDGSTSDIEWNRESLLAAANLFELSGQKGVFIADSKLICQEHVKTMMNPEKQIRFISRCPASFSEKLESRAVKKACKEGTFENLGTFGKGKNAATYEGCEVIEEAFGYKLKLIVLKTSAGRDRFERKKEKQLKLINDEISKVEKKEFACRTDAEIEVSRFKKQCKNSMYLCSYEYVEEKVVLRKKGRPSKNDKPQESSKWRISIKVIGVDNDIEEATRRSEECFVLITNVFDLTMGELLGEYKNQQVVEMDFRMMKEPNMISSVFLKSPERIEVLCMLINVALLVRALVQYKLRKGFSGYLGTREKLGRNYGKLQDNPTFRFLQDCLKNIYFTRIRSDEYDLHMGEPRRKHRAEVLMDFIGYSIDELLE